MASGCTAKEDYSAAGDKNALIQEELEALTLEMKEFFHDELPVALQRMRSKLEIVENSWPNNTIEHDFNTNKLKASVSLHGCKIIEASITLKMLKEGRKAPLRHSLKKPLGLEQVMFAQNSVGELLDGLENFLNQISKLRMSEHKKLNEYNQINAFLQKFLQQSLNKLRDTCRSLRLPNPRRFPFSFPINEIFSPALPPELVFEFSVHRAQLCFDAFGIRDTQGTIESLQPHESGKDYIHKKLLYRDRAVEVMDHTHISLMLPVLDDILGILDECISMVVQVREHSMAFVDAQ